MQYAILIYEPESDTVLRDDPAKAPEYWAGWTAYSQAIAADIMRGGEGLQPFICVSAAENVMCKMGPMPKPRSISADFS